MNDHVQKCAVQLGDKQLLAKLSADDLVTQEGKCHTRCLASLYKNNYMEGSGSATLKLRSPSEAPRGRRNLSTKTRNSGCDWKNSHM